ncbi:MAG: type III pantothenate kinase [Thermoflexales bacterium]|nr:type III pantothenate kinase [Thermoflexales bacterium]
MLLCIDVGNSNIKFGLFRGDEYVASWRISTNRAQLTDEYAMLLLNLFASQSIPIEEVSGCAISCVVPPLTPVMNELSQRYLYHTPVIVGPGVRTGVRIRTDHPAEVGSDRVSNAAAAYRLYGGPAIAIAFGTATAFDAISDTGDYLGGAIAPGLATGAEALFRFAAKLPQVELARPPLTIGKNTIHSMQSGLIFGYAGMVEGLVKRMGAELGPGVRVIATGGLAELIAAETDVIEAVEPHLTLIGLRLIYELNR